MDSAKRDTMQLHNMTPDLALIRADGLTLEPQTMAHADEMFVVLSDPAIYEYENQPPRSLEWLRERFGRLESRCSADGSEQWLNWVIRLPNSELAGYVQATVFADGHAAIAYELSSAYWGRGLARRAVQAMIAELAEHYHVHIVTAVLKRENQRSLRLLERLGFSVASAKSHAEQNVDPSELLMQREVQTHERSSP
jgi:[ribosomal protein S5]-alanine N-acetyltransferase